jgi:hypothetical protein
MSPAVTVHAIEKCISINRLLTLTLSSFEEERDGALRPRLLLFPLPQGED